MGDRCDTEIARHDREMAAIRAELNRAVRLSVEETRRERLRRKDLDDKITQLAAAQLLTEEQIKQTQVTLDRFIESLRKPGSGNH